MNSQNIDLEKLQAEVTALKKASRPRKSSRLNEFYLIGFYILLVALIAVSIYTIRLQRASVSQLSKVTAEKSSLSSEKDQLIKTVDDRNNLVAKYGTELATIKKDYWQLQSDAKKNSNAPSLVQPTYTAPITALPANPFSTPAPTTTCNSTYNVFGGWTTTCR